MNKSVLEEKKQNNLSTHDLQNDITVIPSTFWLMLIGGIIIVIAFLLWACFGWMTETVTLIGVYHPNICDEGEILCFPPLQDGKSVNTGMDITVYLTSHNQQSYGHMKGKVTYVDSYVTPVSEIKELLEDDMLVNAYIQQGPVVAVFCKLTEDSTTQNGYYWSSKKGGSLDIKDGTFMTISVTIAREHPIELFLPDFQTLFH